MKTTKEDLDERLAYTSLMMTRLRSRHAVIKDVTAKFSVTSRTVDTWIAKVRAARRAEAATTERDVARDAARADINAMIALALNRTEVVYNKDGTVALDGAGKAIVRAKPDLQRAAQLMKQLTDLDALAEPTTHVVTVKANVDVEAVPDFGKMSDEQLRAAAKLVEALAPGQDVGAMLGEAFKMSGKRPDPPKKPEPTAIPGPGVERSQ